MRNNGEKAQDFPTIASGTCGCELLDWNTRDPDAYRSFSRLDSCLACRSGVSGTVSDLVHLAQRNGQV